MKAHLFGVRGSTPAPGRDFVRYGGHTSCVALSHDGELPSLILDGGTGLRSLTRHLGNEPFRGTILLGHLHWDHTQGLPFFGAAAVAGSQTTVLVPDQGMEAVEVMERAMSPPHFPLRPSELRGTWRFASIEPGRRDFDGWSVLALDIPHGGGRTYGFRISDGTGTIAYISDHSPTTLGPGPDGLGEIHPAALVLSEEVDVLLHDAQHRACEFPALEFLGHSTVEYSIALAIAARAQSLTLFHHDPDRTDDEIDAIVGACRQAPVVVEAAAEGRMLNLPSARHGRAPRTR